MRVFTALVAAAVLVGCGKGGKSEDSLGTNTNVVPDLSFKASVAGTGLNGTVSDDAVLAQKATNVLMGALGLAFADEGVQAKMKDHDDPLARNSHCWEGPVIPLSFFTLNYAPCEDMGIAGGMIFNDDPQGPVGMDFKNVIFNSTRKINGALGFDAVGAQNQRWSLYDTQGLEPTRANRLPIEVEIDGREGEITFDGGAYMRDLDGRTDAWGIVQFGEYGMEPFEILVGSTDRSILTNPVVTSEPAYLTFAYEVCRCPTSGLYALEMDFLVNEVVFDLDDLLTDSDEVDDPPVTLSVSTTVSGPVEAHITGCGEWDVDYTGTSTVEVEVSGDDLQAAISNLCNTAVITDTGRCTALQLAADKAGSVTVTVDTATLAESVGLEAGIAFDNAYCRP